MITVEQAIQNIMDIKAMYTWSIGADEALDMAIQALKEKEKLEKYPLSPLLEKLYKEGEG